MVVHFHCPYYYLPSIIELTILEHDKLWFQNFGLKSFVSHRVTLALGSKHFKWTIKGVGQVWINHGIFWCKLGFGYVWGLNGMVGQSILINMQNHLHIRHLGHVQWHRIALEFPCPSKNQRDIYQSWFHMMVFTTIKMGYIIFDMNVIPLY